MKNIKTIHKNIILLIVILNAYSNAAFSAEVVMDDIQLHGRYDSGSIAFTLEGEAKVSGRGEARLEIFSGVAALDRLPELGKYIQLEFSGAAYSLVFSKRGEYPLKIDFRVPVRKMRGWNCVSFGLVSSARGRLNLEGLPADAKVEIAGGTQPEKHSGLISAYLSAQRPLSLKWKEEAPKEEGKLFYSSESISQIEVGAGLLKSTDNVTFEIMQGKLDRIRFAVVGSGEITLVEGENLLNWRVEDEPSGGRVLEVNLNEAQESQYRLMVQMQMALNAFPQDFEPVCIYPLDAISLSGFLQVSNAGAVKLEVLDLRGFSQISPELFPVVEVGRSTGKQSGKVRKGRQVFAYRYSGRENRLRLHAEDIMPELSLSSLMIYHLGESNVTLWAEQEIEIREAPLREFSMLIPEGYTIANIAANELNDYYVSSNGSGYQSLRLVFSKPKSGRSLITLRLEKNDPIDGSGWELPKVLPSGVNSIRGYIGVAADAGIRLSSDKLNGLTEMAGSFFPKKVKGLQLAYRMKEEDWTGAIAIERLAVSIQTETLNLFSLGEGMIFGSSLISYRIVGAPVQSLTVELPSEMGNVEFEGKNLRSWKRAENRYEVMFHGAVSGVYSLMATYDKKFDVEGERVSFAGVKPIGGDSEQGHIIIVSDHQYKVGTALSNGLYVLEVNEIPAEYQLLYDSTVLGAYQYISRPYELELDLALFEQSELLQQVVEHADLDYRVNGNNEIMMDIRYLLKQKEASYFRVKRKNGVNLWQALVKGKRVHPVVDETAEHVLIPLPGNAEANDLIEVQLKMVQEFMPEVVALTLETPVLDIPVVLTEWGITAESGYDLKYVGGTLESGEKFIDRGGWRNGLHLFQGKRGIGICVSIVLACLAMVILRKALGVGGILHKGNVVFGSMFLLLAIGISGYLLSESSYDVSVSDGGEIHFRIPNLVAQKSVSLSVESRLRDASFVWDTAAFCMSLGGGVIFILFVVGLLRGEKAELSSIVILSKSCAWSLVFMGALMHDHTTSAFLAAWLVFLLGKLFACRQIFVVFMRSFVQLLSKREVVQTAMLMCAFSLWTEDTKGESLLALPVEKEIVIPAPKLSVGESVELNVNIHGTSVDVHARFQWSGEDGDEFIFLKSPAILKNLDELPRYLRLKTNTFNGETYYSLLADKKRVYAFECSYEIQIDEPNGVQRLSLPSATGLLTRASLSIDRPELDIGRGTAVSVVYRERRFDKKTEADIVFVPQKPVSIEWKPKVRDVGKESASFYVELIHLYRPQPGLISGFHEAIYRLAQGEIRTTKVRMPDGITVTSVSGKGVNDWRFNPEKRELAINFEHPKRDKFVLRVETQTLGGALPFEGAVQGFEVLGALRQVAKIGIAAGSDIQLSNVRFSELSRINLEDFPGHLIRWAASRGESLRLRHGFSAGALSSPVVFEVLPVKPDIRVVSKQSLSFSEDHSTLGVNLSVQVKRAGIFNFSFVLPEGLEVEGLRSEYLSHWTELEKNGERIITIHLKGKVIGVMPFYINFSSSGDPGKSYMAPRISIREASKESGQLVVVPERGFRLQVSERRSITQVDPKLLGVKQQDALVFKLLTRDWLIRFEVEMVDPWVSAEVLQYVSIKEGMHEYTACFRFKIDNAGVKSLWIALPKNVTGVRFVGESVSNSVAFEDGSGLWEVKLQRKIIGSYELKVFYSLYGEGNAVPGNIEGVRCVDANLQRGFLSIQSKDKLEIVPGVLPDGLILSEWQAVPEYLRSKLAEKAAFTYRVVEPLFTFPVSVIRHENADVLQAEVDSVELLSVLSENNTLLTDVRISLKVGEKRHLRVVLPEKAVCWSATVNMEGVMPWKDGNGLLIPLSTAVVRDQATVVHLLYSLEVNSNDVGRLEWNGPEFDLPLENIVWNLYVPEHLSLDEEMTDGTLKLKRVPGGVYPASSWEVTGRDGVLSSNEAQTRSELERYHVLMEEGNRYYAKGNQQLARRALSSAYNLSQDNKDYNEDARIQLNNLRMNQAVLGLANRMNKFKASNGQSGLTESEKSLSDETLLNFTQNDYRFVVDGFTAEDSNLLKSLAKRLLEQQNAAVFQPQAIRSTIPKEGRVYQFTRDLQVDVNAPMSLQLMFEEPPFSVGESTRSWVGFVVLLALMFFIIRLEPRRIEV